MRGRDAGVVGLVMHSITSHRPQDAVPGPFGRTNPWWVRPTPRALGWLPGVRRLAFGQGMRWVRGRRGRGAVGVAGMWSERLGSTTCCPRGEQ